MQQFKINTQFQAATLENLQETARVLPSGSIQGLQSMLYTHQACHINAQRSATCSEDKRR